MIVVGDGVGGWWVEYVIVGGRGIGVGECWGEMREVNVD